MDLWRHLTPLLPFPPFPSLPNAWHLHSHPKFPGFPITLSSLTFSPLHISLQHSLSVSFSRSFIHIANNNNTIIALFLQHSSSIFFFTAVSVIHAKTRKKTLFFCDCISNSISALYLGCLSFLTLACISPFFPANIDVVILVSLVSSSLAMR